MRTLVAAFFASLALILAMTETASAQQHGLTGYYYSRAEEKKAVITGPYDYKTVDRRIDFSTATWSWTPFNMEKQFSVYWNGWLFIDAKQNYRFAALARGGAEVYVDEIKVVEKPEHPEKQFTASGLIPLDPGYHRIEVIYFNWRGAAGIALMWNRGGSFEVVPSTRLYPEDAISPDTPWPQPASPETQP